MSDNPPGWKCDEVELVFEALAGAQPREVERLDLPMEMSLHEYHGDDHTLFGLDALITQGHGQGFAQRLTRHGVRFIATSASDPLAAATAVAAGQPLPEPLPHDHDHGHETGHAQAHSVGAPQIPVTLGQ